MNVLLVDGFSAPHAIPQVAHAALTRKGHTVTELGLLERGFDQYMSAAERRVYHDADNLITAETQESASLLRSHDAVLVCTSEIQGAIAPLAKSWFERVFIPGVSFTFTKSGRVTGALTNVKRIGLVLDCPNGVGNSRARTSSAKSVIRGVWMSAAKTCRTTYVTVAPEDEGSTKIAGALRRW